MTMLSAVPSSRGFSSSSRRAGSMDSGVSILAVGLRLPWPVIGEWPEVAGLVSAILGGDLDCFDSIVCF